MRRTIGAFVLGAGLSLIAYGGEARPATGSFTVTDWVPGKNTVLLTLKSGTATSHWNWASTQELSDLKGLTRDQLRGHSKVVFAVARDAGTFFCEGTGTMGVARGTYRFVGNPAFIGKLEALGFKSAGDPDLMRMAINDISLDFAAAAKNAGLKDVTVDDLSQLRDHGVDVKRLEEIAKCCTGLTTEQVIRLQDHGVEPAYLREMKASGNPAIDADQVVTLHDHGIEPAFVKGLSAAGRKSLSIDELIRLHDHGVEPAFVKGLADAGRGDLTVDDMVKLHDHGVDAKYVAKVQASGYDDLSVDEIVRLHDHGVD